MPSPHRTEAFPLRVQTRPLQKARLTVKYSTPLSLDPLPSRSLQSYPIQLFLCATHKQTAQFVQNAPKQHIARKAPTDKTTTGGGGGASAGDLESPSSYHIIAKELMRRRGGSKPRSLSSGSSPVVHIRPWESAVPIHAPSSSAVVSIFSNNKVPIYQQQGSSYLSPRRQGRKYGVGDDNNGALLSPSKRQNAEVVRTGKSRTRRPATAGAIRTRSTEGHHAAGSPRGSGRRNLIAEMHPSSSVGTIKASEMAPQRGRGEGLAAATRGGLLSSDQKLLSTRPGDHHHRERVATWRVFDSAAAEWVQTAVLQRAASRRAGDSHERRRSSVVAASRTQRTIVGNRLPPAAAAAAGCGEDAGASLTTAAKSAVEEVFDRYDRNSSAACRGFLLSAEISALQGIWTRPDDEPPPPRQQIPSSSSKLPKRPDRTSPQTIPTTGGGSPPPKVSEERESDGRGTRVLTRPAFVEFCRRAAARDAIFMRHFFTRSGYNYRLELPVPVPCDNATTTNTTAEPAAVALASSARPRKGSVVSERRRSEHGVGKDGPAKGAGSRNRQGSRSRIQPRRDGSPCSIGSGGGGGVPRGTESPTSVSAYSPQERGLFQCENDDVQCLVSGGIVDPAELWLWTDDRRDHGERKKLDGLLSRGGGAHVSRAVAAIVSAFAMTKHPNSDTAATQPASDSRPQASDVPQQPADTPPTDEDAADETGTTATSLITKALGSECGRALVGHEASVARFSDSTMANDKAHTDDRTGSQCGRVVPKAAGHGDVPRAGLAIESAAARGGVTATCEWCGVVVVVGGKESATAAVHSAAFCDEEIMPVHRIR